MKRIGILTSGGDAPAMNAAIRAVARKAISSGLEAYGINYGFAGLVAGDIHKFEATDLDNSIDTGGTLLYSARYPEFAQEEGQLKGIEQLKKFGIDALVVIGGDGSYHGALRLTEHGYNTIGLPGTIDNDIPYTDFTIGFDTALNTAVDAIDKIRDTAKSHQRVFAIQVMGRFAADIALWAGVASGADAVIAPGFDYSVEKIANKLKKNRANGKDYGLIVIAEGDANSDAAPEFIDQLKQYGDFDARATVIGHVQRGGVPSARDRVLASKMGAYAVELLLEGRGGLAVGILDNKVQAHDITDLFDAKHQADLSLHQLAEDLSFK
ncbi:6-phosphofructokinase [Pediococcus claussenii]|uniref:ATP-dependent 6-phosphofructokinase n=1 Tax=Pediococcus claussenii (strain ATCC BAA-344 / DSM 14800 / JCM 18046 / KCTC 3811 / LMG 21948 / P06) TaxID=701521 RepID=G8PD27_PEDCP|nr:6-phosphofructokinase [Pediococcus claussenii]AEV95162.1 6-phosphofructokinase [Pediococcus claussenii ATCC BAA-344]ANZ70395.1 ATP-dependent 6-phosphofructokinase [Pediococcus claussenii]ANZ72211.1 ATP-dependent 6-phosphofructokinase [Pediococcus claussenii]KRN19655.1 pfkA protein [Pediococcus claussenii]